MSAAAERSALGIVGAGTLGRALAEVSRGPKGAQAQRVLLWGHAGARTGEGGAGRAGEPPLIEEVATLAELAAAARLIVLAVPARAAREVVRGLGDVVDGGHLMVHAARGLEPETGKRVSQIIREETCVLRIGALAGPLTARDLTRGDPAACVVGSRFDDVIAETKHMLAGPRLRVYGNRDLTGVELAAALGGALSFGAGVASGLGFGAATRAVLETRGLGELARLGEKLGAGVQTFFGLAGVGARVAHAASEPDDDFRYGEMIGKGGSAPGPAGEPDGASAARSAAALAARTGVRAPLLLALKALLEGSRSPAEVGRDLMVHAAVDE